MRRRRAKGGSKMERQPPRQLVALAGAWHPSRDRVWGSGQVRVGVTAAAWPQCQARAPAGGARGSLTLEGTGHVREGAAGDLLGRGGPRLEQPADLVRVRVKIRVA
eukprot:scaffold90854_cov36-Phaeocystis_antarctica.AAC.1